jgi:hypothetical protein
MIEYLYALAADIENAVTTSDGCEVDRVTVTAGEPAAPAGENCKAVWVWLNRIEDAAAFTDDCAVRTRVTFSYRIDVCYTETEQDQTDLQHSIPADCLTGLADSVWCGLVGLKDTGDLMGLGTCEHVILEPLLVGARQGGIVSATGGVTFTYDCLVLP